MNPRLCRMQASCRSIVVSLGYEHLPACATRLHSPDLVLALQVSFSETVESLMTKAVSRTPDWDGYKSATPASNFMSL